MNDSESGRGVTLLGFEKFLSMIPLVLGLLGLLLTFIDFSETGIFLKLSIVVTGLIQVLYAVKIPKWPAKKSTIFGGVVYILIGLSLLQIGDVREFMLVRAFVAFWVVAAFALIGILYAYIGLNIKPLGAWRRISIFGTLAILISLGIAFFTYTDVLIYLLSSSYLVVIGLAFLLLFRTIVKTDV